MSRMKKTEPAEAVTQNSPEPIEPTTRRGVLITPHAFATLTTLKSPLETFDKQPWVDCPVTHTLGLPLKATRWPSINSWVPNNLALVLFLNPDPQEDTVDVREREVGMVLTYLSGLSVGITTFLREEPGKVDDEVCEERKVEVQADRASRARSLAEKTLTAAAFRKYAKGRVMKKV
ncbi:hypothetical protein LTR74_016787 [Friedmanniomyces endolithicus]|nr:hypothetical protein LTR74_016787 [Friedmanniomyces endolithicus]